MINHAPLPVAGGFAFISIILKLKNFKLEAIVLQSIKIFSQNRITLIFMILITSMVMWTPFMIYLICKNGDIIDLISYIFFLFVIFIFINKHKRKTGFINIVAATLFSSINIIFLDSLNKVDGYPDKEFKLSIYFCILFVFHVWIVYIFIKYRKQYILLLLLNLLIIHLSSVILVPGSIIRQYVAGKNCTELPGEKSGDTKISYFTKIQSDAAYAIGKIDHYHDIVLVYKFDKSPDEKKYIYSETKWLLDGSGTMDAQVPNQSKIFKIISSYFFRLFHE